jgi:hypothetical protein
MLVQDFEKLGVYKGSSKPAESLYLSFGHDGVDDFFCGGIPLGSVSEWGMPLGCGARGLILRLLAQLTSTGHDVLWIYPKTRIYAYPPGWAAAGVDLNRVSFVRTDNPLRDLKSAFLETAYKAIVFDFPTRLTKDDFAFLSRQAREFKFVVMVLRNSFLKLECGNIWAKFRMNCTRGRTDARLIRIEIIRGLAPKTCELYLESGALR